MLVTICISFKLATIRHLYLKATANYFYSMLKINQENRNKILFVSTRAVTPDRPSPWKGDEDKLWYAKEYGYILKKWHNFILYYKNKSLYF